MRSLTSVGILLAVCGLAAAGHLHHYPQHVHHGSSYVAFSKHEEPVVKHDWADHHHHHQHHEQQQQHHHHETAHFEHKSGHDSDAHEDYDGHNDHEEDYYAAPKYEFDYAVKDEKTGDAKKHWETRDGDKVKGAYTIKEADGTTRIVEYTADHKNGYNAVVKTVGHAHVEHDSHDYSHHGH